MHDTAQARTIAGYFSGSYAEARKAFLDACESAGVSVRSHVMPGLRGPQGEELAMDVARAGAVSPARLVIVSSGTHGIEGYAGSACQTGLLRAGLATDLPPGAGIVFIHAVNPYGFAHERRVNEDNIDLNRNFLDHDAGYYPDSSAYEALHEVLASPDYGFAEAEGDAAVRQWIAAHGLARFRAGVSPGQYTRPDGLFYGGRAPALSNTTLRRVLGECCGDAQEVRFIDIHTGLGAYGHGEKMGLGDAAQVERARAIWGRDVTDLAGGEAVSVKVSGDIGGAFFAAVPTGIPAAAMALEFGTLDGVRVLNALRLDNWWHMHARKSPEGTREETPEGAAGADDAGLRVRAAMRRAFYPDDPAWRAQVFAQARAAVHAALTAAV